MSFVDSSLIPLEHKLYTAEKNISGNASTGECELGVTETLKCGLWEHNVGESLQGSPTAADEVFVVISGRGRVHLGDGRVLHLEPGVVGRLRAGESTRWVIEETFRKVWIVEKNASPA